MRILIVKLSSLGDVVHALPVVADIRRASPDTSIDWVVEPAFAAVVRGVDGIGDVIECALRRWRRSWWSPSTWRQVRGFVARLRSRRYDAVIDLQGLTKSALVASIARGPSYGLANRTHGASHEGPARWLVTHAIRVEPHSHALDRSRELVARALGHASTGAPRFGLRVDRQGDGLRSAGGADAGFDASAGTSAGARAGARDDQHVEASADAVARSIHRPVVVFVHGTSRDDKLWPEAHWIALGRRVIDAGWCVWLPQSGAIERARADRIASVLGAHVVVLPSMDLGALVTRMGRSDGVIGVDSGLSHVAVALDLPHVQIYRYATAWRTGPLASHGHRHQVAVGDGALGAATGAGDAPSVDEVCDAWRHVLAVAR